MKNYLILKTLTFLSVTKTFFHCCRNVQTGTIHVPTSGSRGGGTRRLAPNGRGAMILYASNGKFPQYFSLASISRFILNQMLIEKYGRNILKKDLYLNRQIENIPARSAYETKQC